MVHNLNSIKGEYMKKLPVFFGILLILMSIISVSAAGNTITATSQREAAALVYVSGYEMDPGVFYPYESGTITVHVSNAANASVMISQPDLISPNLHVSNKDTFSTSTNVGPGATVDYTFLVTADCTDGTYFPLFTVSSNVPDANAIHAILTLKVDSADVRATISDKPENFAISKTDTVNVSVINPRDNEIINVLVMASGPGAEISPREQYIGTIAANSKAETTFRITPDTPEDVVFNVTFDNGDNHRKTSVVLPLNIGDDKTGAEIVVNNIESSGSGMTQTLKGDVTNNGLTDAKSVLVTVGGPATPVNPNPVYAIGNLEPDDFSSFEVTYTMTGNGAVPLIVDYKDADGNSFSKTFSIAASNSSAMPGSPAMNNAPAGASSQRRGMFGSFGSGFSQIPVTEIVVILIAIVILIYAWRKGLLRRLTNKFRKDPLPETDDSEEQE